MALVTLEDGRKVETKTIKDVEYITALTTGLSQMIKAGTLKLRQSDDPNVFFVDYRKGE